MGRKKMWQMLNEQAYWKNFNDQGLSGPSGETSDLL
jgi:hypothetical protein